MSHMSWDESFEWSKQVLEDTEKIENAALYACNASVWQAIKNLRQALFFALNNLEPECLAPLAAPADEQ